MPSPFPAGQPTKLTPEVQAKVVEALSVVPFWAPAAAYAGIGLSTLKEWLTRGRRYRDSLTDEGNSKDQLAQKMWRQADAFWNSGQRQAAYAVLARLDARLDQSSELPYYQFLLAAEAARSRVEVELAALTLRGARDNPVLALQMLTRAFPERWSERRAVDPDDTTDSDDVLAEKQAAATELLERVRGNGTNGR